MTLAEFIAMVKDEANKGSALDAYIPNRVQMAVMRAERKYTLLYMMVLDTDQTLDPDADDPRVLEIDANIKSINFIRYTHCARYVYLNLVVDPSNVLSNDVGCKPTGYWLNGPGEIVFDNAVSEELDLEISYNVYSEYPIDDDCWLLSHATDWLLGETMKLLSTRAKEPKWRDDYKEEQAEAENDLFRADNEARTANAIWRMEQPGTDRGEPRYRKDQS